MDETSLPQRLRKALNQLGSVLAGKELALQTNHLSENPVYRVEEMLCESNNQLMVAAATGDTKSLKQAQRKVQSLTSLLLIAEVLSNHRCLCDE